MKICVFGAEGLTGGHVIGQALKRGWQVVGVDRDEPHDPYQGPAIEYRTADVLEDDLSKPVTGCDAVISALGVGNDPRTLLDPPPLYTEGTRRIVEGMRGAGVSRLVAISATFVATQERGPLHFRVPAMIALDRIFDQMREMETMLRGMDDLEWTAVRPGWLMAGEATDDYTVQADTIPEGTIRTRHADLATLMLDCVAEGSWVRQTPAIAREESEEATSVRQVVREMLP